MEQGTKRVTIRVGLDSLRAWQLAARKELAWNVNDWIAATCNRRAVELVGDELAAERRASARVAGPVSVRGRKGGGR